MDEFITYGEVTAELERPISVEDIFDYRPPSEDLPEDELVGF